MSTLEQKNVPLSADAVARLVDTARRTQQRGDTARARLLLQRLAQQNPDTVAVWQALADVAENDAERLEALERMAALEPKPQPQPRSYETQRLEVVEPPAPVVEPFPEPEPQADPLVWQPVSLTPSEPEPNPARQIRWPVYVIIAIALLILLLVALFRWSDLFAPQQSAAPPAPAPELSPVIPTLRDAATSAIPTSAPVGQSPVAASPQPTQAPPLPTRPLQPTQRPRLTAGTVIKEGEWDISLLRPEHALLLDGSIGSMQPQGRFALAIVSISNVNQVASRFPAELFTLEDEKGRRYRPVPGASTAYLTAFARGVNGDLSVEEEIPANAGFVSIPVIFDVPLDARDLRLFIGDTSVGWPLPGGANP